MKISIDSIFKTNDRVYHHHYGWGTIKDIHYGVNKRILIEFDDTPNLVREMFNEKPVLSFSEYKLVGFSQERPEELPKKGQIVWVRGEFPSEWIIGHFLKKSDGRYYVSRDNKNSNGWGYEIRTTNPYENEN